MSKKITKAELQAQVDTLTKSNAEQAQEIEKLRAEKHTLDDLLERRYIAHLIDLRQAEVNAATLATWKRAALGEAAQTVGRGRNRAEADPVYRIFRDEIRGWHRTHASLEDTVRRRVRTELGEAYEEQAIGILTEVIAGDVEAAQVKPKA